MRKSKENSPYIKDQIVVKRDGTFELSIRDFNTILKLSGSRAKTSIGKERAVTNYLSKAVGNLAKMYGVGVEAHYER